MARSRGESTSFGGVMDDVSDRYILGVIYAGGCLSLPKLFQKVRRAKHVHVDPEVSEGFCQLNYSQLIYNYALTCHAASIPWIWKNRKPDQ